MYKNILVAIDFSEHASQVVKKSVEIAKHHQANLHFIHVDVNLNDIYVGLVNLSLGEHSNEETSKLKFEEFRKLIDYPISSVTFGKGDLEDVIVKTIQEKNVDLLIAGHRKDFWGKILSSSKSLIDSVSTDVLIVPLK